MCVCANVHVCVCVCIYTYILIFAYMAHVWYSEVKSLLPPAGFPGLISASRLGSKCIYPLGYLDIPCMNIFKFTYINYCNFDQKKSENTNIHV